MKDIQILDEDTGCTLTYKWRDSYGWCVSFSEEAYANEDIALFRRIMKLSKEHWPEIPEEYREQIEENYRALREGF